MTTSSTSAGSTLARLTAFAMTCPAIVAPWVWLNAPRNARPIGVRAAETIAASGMGQLLGLRGIRRLRRVARFRRVMHRSAVMRRETVAVDPDDVDVAGS